MEQGNRGGALLVPLVLVGAVDVWACAARLYTHLDTSACAGAGRRGRRGY